ncbi:MAG: substrate-binding domain-containing protein [Clostridia bacterium]|nr:substrate-binding domain-containing protein [Clostridia bacterium]
MKKIVIALVLVCMLAAMFGCSQQTKTEPQPEYPFTADTYPKVDGSTATIPLSEQFFSDATGVSLGDASTYIKHNTTHNAYVNLINGDCDIIFVTSPSEEEYALAAEAGVELEVHPVVNEGFIFMVNEKNPVDNLTREQIVAIYTDQITNWSEVGGEDKEIIAYQREVNSGSQTGFLDLVMGDVEPADAPTEKRIVGMGELVESISAYDNSDQALGYSYYFYVNEMYVREAAKLIAVDGVYPSPETIADGSYPYTTAYYAVIRADEPEDSPARTLLNWTLSEDGQKAAKEAGYVPLA